nr:FTR1 family protein [Brevibacillus fulvus]
MGKRYLPNRLLAAVMAISAIVWLFGVQPGTAAGAQANSGKPEQQLLLFVGDALVAIGDQDWPDVAAHLQQFAVQWQKLDTNGKSSEQVQAALQQAQAALAQPNPDQQTVYQAFSQLAKATNRFLAAGTEQTGDKAIAAAQTMAVLLQQLSSTVANGELEQAKQQYDQLYDKWLAVESAVRTEHFDAYAAFETSLSLVRVAISTEPPQPDKMEQAIANFASQLDRFISGQWTKSDSVAQSEVDGIAGLLQLLAKAQQQITAEQSQAAADTMQQFIVAWPMAEGQVQTRSPQTYSDVETKMTEVPGILLSTPPNLARAEQLIQSIRSSLEPFAEQTQYTAWDAAMILVREGLEALLVVAALLAFLHRTGNKQKQAWIWSGVACGVLVSCGTAFLLSYLLSQAKAGSSSELIEGIAGLVSVGLMLTVGAWLHQKSNVKAWNNYIQNKMNAALSTGALWSLGITSFLALLREGTETVIFYIGMTASIQTSQLLLGIGGALVFLLLLGYVLIVYSGRIPVRPFFLIASFLIYYLAFKYVGGSIHALQVAGKLPTHVPGYLPTINGLGVYPSLETTIPQIFILLIILILAVRTVKGRSYRKLIKKEQV